MCFEMSREEVDIGSLVKVASVMRGLEISGHIVKHGDGRDCSGTKREQRGESKALKRTKYLCDEYQQFMGE